MSSEGAHTQHVDGLGQHDDEAVAAQKLPQDEISPDSNVQLDVQLHVGEEEEQQNRDQGVAFDFGAVADEGMQGDEQRRLYKVVAASMIGNILEWYDFGVFAYIGARFFPKTDSTSALLQAFVVFGGAFFIRPLGGVVFGHIGDKYGRKQALYVSVAMMAGSTFLMGCLPTYETAGLLATLLLVLCRVTQGLSVGGELVGSMIYAVESSPPNRQVLMGALCLTGAITGLTMGSLVGLIIHFGMSEEDVLDWGWRIPFISGVFIGIFALWIRNGLHESLEFEESIARRKEGQEMVEKLKDSTSEDEKMLMAIPQGNPLLRSIREHPMEILVMFLVSGCFSIGVWVLVAFPPSLYQDLMDPPLGYPRGDVRRGEPGAMYDRSKNYIWIMHTSLCVVQMVSITLFGWLGDHVGNVRMMALSCLLIAVFAVPCLSGMGQGSILAAVLGQGTMNLIIGVAGGNLPTWMVKAFPVETRFTAIAVGYNAAQALFGGTAGILATLIYSKTGSTELIGVYHALTAVISFFCVLWLERKRRSTDDPLQWMKDGITYSSSSVSLKMSTAAKAVGLSS